jgi:diacylglycerol kinase (ATP)
MKARIIVNPNAGSYEAARQAIERASARDGCEVVETKERGDAMRLAKEAIALGFDRVVAAGGDGTLHEIVNGVGANAPIGVGLLPLGTGNDFARGIGIPLNAPDEALRIALEAPLSGVDLLLCTTSRGDSLVVNVAAGGLNEAITREVDANLKKAIGPVAYLFSAAKQVLDPPVFGVRIEAEGRAFAGTIHAIAVANGARIGGGLPIAPSASPSDGRFNVYLLPERSRGEVAIAGLELLLGAHEESRDVIWFATDSMTFEVDPPMRVHLDGEGAESDRFAFKALHRAMRFAAPTVA